MIRFESVTKYFGDKKVLERVNFTVAAGETFVIVGFSGAGKSVALKHMIRLLTPDYGKVFVGGQIISRAAGRELQKLRERFGVLFQGAALLEWMSVGDNIALPLREKTNMGETEIRRRVNERLEQVNLEHAYNLFPSELSGGMRKRVGLARSLVMNPDIILYDEPTSGLDPVTSRSIDQLIDRMRVELKVTNVVVTHDLFSALAIGSRIAMLYNGRILEISSPAEFIRSRNEIVRSFLESQYITKRGKWEAHINEKQEN
ncbi:MAG: ATP-binding cassette domain-containing protein [Kiritimatiellae bacterium]|nr:ATP-binding cassette domain-containing protein [Kiritimatiellia bacterium]